MAIKIVKHWEDVETFTVDVIDKRGDVFEWKGKPWRMELRPPDSDAIKAVLRKNAAEASAWRQRQPRDRRDDELPEAMSLRHTYRIVSASHVAWHNAPLEGDTAVDFTSDDFDAFLKEEGWYVAQWQKAWTDRKNAARLKTGNQPKTTSSSGAKNK